MRLSFKLIVRTVEMCGVSITVEVFNETFCEAITFPCSSTPILLWYQYLHNVSSNLQKNLYGQNFTDWRFNHKFVSEPNLSMQHTIIRVHVCCARRLFRSAPVAAFLALLNDSATELCSKYGTNSSFMTNKLLMAKTSLNMKTFPWKSWWIPIKLTIT